ncbi:MAG: lasso RiPP family leader peptide-containing protein [Acidobacteria bacterium]|nr:lasso RiPP family leader peptide-containing protein [Acidobacteriota bacterium]
MQNNYEAPELTLVGDAEEVVMGSDFGGDDYPQHVAWDFEFAQD